MGHFPAGPSGGSGVLDITSVDGSISITHPAGPTTDLSAVEGVTYVLFTKGMIESAAWNGLFAANNAAPAVANIAQSVATGLPLISKTNTPGNLFSLQGQIFVDQDIPMFLGAGPFHTEFRFATGAGIVNQPVPNPTGVPFTPQTADGLSTGFVFGTNATIGNYSGPGGMVGLFSYTTNSAGGASAPILAGAGLSYPAGWSAATPSNVPGLTINGTTISKVFQVRGHGWGIAGTACNNAGGLHIEDFAADYGFNNLGWQILGTGQGGSDWYLPNAWIHGVYGGLAIAGGTDYNFQSGQISCNQGNILGLHAGDALEQSIDPVAVGRNWLDGTVGPDGLPGTPNTGGIGAAGIIRFSLVDFEGTQHGTAAVHAYTSATIEGLGCNVIAYPLAANGTGSQGCLAVVRQTSAGNGVTRWVGGQIKGSYQSNQLFQIAGNAAGFMCAFEEVRGQQATSIAGVTPFGGASGDLLPGDWLVVDCTVNTGALTNPGRFSGLGAQGVPYRAECGSVNWRGQGTATDLARRTDGAGNDQISTDGVTWLTVTTSASIAILADYATTGILPNSPTYAAGVITAGSNTNLHLDGCTGGLQIGPPNTVVLVKDEGQAGGLGSVADGLYYLSQGGSGAAPWKLTRGLGPTTPGPLAQGAVLPTYQPEPTTPTPRAVEVKIASGQVNSGLTFWLPNAGQTVGTTALVFNTAQTSATAPPAAAVFTPADPAATASTANPGVMAGLGNTAGNPSVYTPVAGTSLLVTISGGGLTNTAVAEFRTRGYFGTGAAPANGAAVTGTAFAQAVQTWRSSAFAAGSNVAWAVTAKVPCTPGTPIWLDVAFSTLSAADTAQLSAVTVEVLEVT